MIELIDKGWRRIEYFIQMCAHTHIHIPSGKAVHSDSSRYIDTISGVCDTRENVPETFSFFVGHSQRYTELSMAFLIPSRTWNMSFRQVQQMIPNNAVSVKFRMTKSRCGRDFSQIKTNPSGRWRISGRIKIVPTHALVASFRLATSFAKEACRREKFIKYSLSCVSSTASCRRARRKSQTRKWDIYIYT